MSNSTADNSRFRPVRFLSTKIEQSGVVQSDKFSDAGREAEEYVEIRYEAERSHKNAGTEEAMLDVVIRTDGVFEFVVWHPSQGTSHSQFRICVFHFDPATTSVQIVRKT